jgi:hypothetical protein
MLLEQVKQIVDRNRLLEVTVIVAFRRGGFNGSSLFANATAVSIFLL